MSAIISAPVATPPTPTLPPELIRIISSSLTHSSAYSTLSSLTLTSSAYKAELHSYLEKGKDFYRVVDERHGGICGVGWEGRLSQGQKGLIREVRNLYLTIDPITGSLSDNHNILTRTNASTLYSSLETLHIRDLSLSPPIHPNRSPHSFTRKEPISSPIPTVQHLIFSPHVFHLDLQHLPRIDWVEVQRRFPNLNKITIEETLGGRSGESEGVYFGWKGRLLEELSGKIVRKDFIWELRFKAGSNFEKCGEENYSEDGDVVKMDGLGIKIELKNEEGLTWRVESAPGACSPEMILSTMGRSLFGPSIASNKWTSYSIRFLLSSTSTPCHDKKAFEACQPLADDVMRLKEVIARNSVVEEFEVEGAVEVVYDEVARKGAKMRLGEGLRYRRSVMGGAKV